VDAKATGRFLVDAQRMLDGDPVPDAGLRAVRSDDDDLSRVAAGILERRDPRGVESVVDGENDVHAASCPFLRS